MRGYATHGNTPFDVPYVSEIGFNLWQGGCEYGLVLPENIVHLVSLYVWEAYTIKHEMRSTSYIRMYDSLDQSTSQIDGIARWVNTCREDGPTLVHCQAGLNRSSLVAARALMFVGPMGLEGDALTGRQAVDHIRETRSPACLCNRAFEQHLLSL
jgi:protein-tyrosine phosphatase